MTAEQPIKLPLCFGGWSSCGLCTFGPLDNACRVYEGSPADIRSDIEQELVEGLASDDREEIRVLVDVLQGLE